MGSCSSCLGGWRPSEPEPADSTHLLGDGYQASYGAAHGAYNGPQPDPEELRRQREALERICAETSEQLIPVSQPNALPEVSEHQAKHDEYARLFNERFRSVRRNRPASASASAPEDEASWLESVAGNQGDEQLEHVIPAQGRLTIQFGSR